MAKKKPPRVRITGTGMPAEGVTICGEGDFYIINQPFEHSLTVAEKEYTLGGNLTWKVHILTEGEL